MTIPRGAVLVSAVAVDTLAYWQRVNMPDRAFVFRRTLARGAGAVMIESYVLAHVDPCRLTMSTATEGNDNGTLATTRRWTLARAVRAEPLDGTERVLVMHARGGSTLVRVMAEAGARTFHTVRKADVTANGAGALGVATSPRSPFRLGWSVSLAVQEG